VGVTVEVRVGVNVSVGRGVHVGVTVFVGVAVSVGPKTCPGPQLEINRLNTKQPNAIVLRFMFISLLRYHGRTRRELLERNGIETANSEWTYSCVANQHE